MTKKKTIKKNIQTPEEFEKEEKEEKPSDRYAHPEGMSLYKTQFISSKSKRFVAYIETETYKSPIDGFSRLCGLGKDWDQNNIMVKDLETGKWDRTQPVLYSSWFGGYKPEIRIDRILEVSDDGKVKYKTGDGLEHILE